MRGASMSERNTTGHIVGDLRAHARGLAADAWSDFKAHWPMHVFDMLREAGVGTLLGAALGFAAAIYVLQVAA